MQEQMSVIEDKSRDRINEDEVDIRLSDVMQFLKDVRWKVLQWVAMFVIVGTLYAFSQPNEFLSTVRVMPELKTPAGGGGLGDLKSLAGLAGVSLDNLSGTSEAIRPDLYPDIIQSVPFTLHLLAQSVTVGGKPQPLKHYLQNQYEGTISNWIEKLSGIEDLDKNPVQLKGTTLQLTKQQEELSNKVGQRVKAVIDKKSGIVTITSQMPDPIIAATVASQTLDYLTNYVTNYRTGKSRRQVEFLTQQAKNARIRYQTSEYAVSSYRDRSRGLFLETAKIEEQRLQADYLLAQTVYNDLSKQLEQARIKVQEESPVFQVLEPAQVPLRKNSPKRALIISGFAVLGAFFALITSLIQTIFRRRFMVIS